MDLRTMSRAGLLAIGLLSWSCGGEDGNEGARAGEIGAVPLDEVHVVGTTEEIARIADLEPMEDGSVWVLNITEPFFIHIDPEGQTLRSWGRGGGGPGEFRSPTTLVKDGESGDTWAFDRAANTLSRVNGAEGEVTTLSISPDDVPPNSVVTTENGGSIGRAWLRPAEGGFLAARTRPGSSAVLRLWNADIVALGLDGSVRTVLAPADIIGSPAERYPGARDFMPFPLWARCPNGAFVLYDPLTNRLRRLSASGAALDSVPLPAERLLEVTPDRVFTMLYPGFLQEGTVGTMPDSAQLRDQLTSQWKEITAEVTPIFPEYGDLQCVGESGEVWIQPFDVESGQYGRGPVWLTVGRDGRTRTIRFPESFRPLRFAKDRVWGSSRDELDVESVAWVDLSDLRP